MNVNFVKLVIFKQKRNHVFIVGLKNMEVLLAMDVVMKKIKMEKKQIILYAKIVLIIIIILLTIIMVFIMVKNIISFILSYLLMLNAITVDMIYQMHV